MRKKLLLVALVASLSATVKANDVVGYVTAVLDKVNSWQKELLCDKGRLGSWARLPQTVLTGYVAWRILEEAPVIKDQWQKIKVRCGCCGKGTCKKKEQ